MTNRLTNLVFGLSLAAAVSGCGVIYTSPSVSSGSPFSGSTNDLAVDVVALTFESTAAANLDPYVPARLPLGFQMDAVKNLVAEIDTPPQRVSVPRPPTQPNNRPLSVEERIPPIEEPEAYLIGVADVLLLSVNTAGLGAEALPGLISAQSKRQGFVVQDDGAIAIPDAGRVRVAGLTLQDAEAVIFQALVEAGIDPTFSLEVAEFNSQRVTVGGQVTSPTLVPITLKPLYLHEAIGSAGGLSVSDPRVSRIQLFRDGETFQISATRFQTDPAVRQIVMRDGDAIYVQSDFEEARARAAFEEQISASNLARQSQLIEVQIEQANSTRQSQALERLRTEREIFEDRLALGAVKRDYAYLTGEVVFPQRFELPFEEKAVLADVLFFERGININFGDYGEIYVLRRSTNPEEPNRLTAYHLNASNAVNLALASVMEIHGGDVVFVAEQPVTAWNRTISQMFPSLFNTVTSVAASL